MKVRVLRALQALGAGLPALWLLASVMPTLLPPSRAELWLSLVMVAVTSYLDLRRGVPYAAQLLVLLALTAYAWPSLLGYMVVVGSLAWCMLPVVGELTGKGRPGTLLTVPVVPYALGLACYYALSASGPERLAGFLTDLLRRSLKAALTGANPPRLSPPPLVLLAYFPSSALVLAYMASEHVEGRLVDLALVALLSSIIALPSIALTSLIRSSYAYTVGPLLVLGLALVLIVRLLYEYS